MLARVNVNMRPMPKYNKRSSSSYKGLKTETAIYSKCITIYETLEIQQQ